MKKFKGIFMVLSLVLVFVLGASVVSAADGDLVVEYKGESLTSKDNGSDQGGIRNPEAGTVSLGEGEGHGLWGYEIYDIDTAGGTKIFTMVVKAKIVVEGEDVSDNVIRLDHKLRVVGYDEAEQPVDGGAYYTGEDLVALTPDADGFITLYSVFGPDLYDDGDKINIESRIWFTSNSGWEIDIYEMAIYEGDVTPEEPDPTPTEAPTETPEATETQTTAPAATTATKAPASTTNASSEPSDTQEGGFPVWAIIVIVVVVIAIVAAIIVMSKKKK